MDEGSGQSVKRWRREVHEANSTLQGAVISGVGAMLAHGSLAEKEPWEETP